MAVRGEYELGPGALVRLASLVQPPALGSMRPVELSFRVCASADLPEGT